MAWFHYELLVVASSWSLLAVESALRDRLGSTKKPRLVDLIKKATHMGLIDLDVAGRLDAGRGLRNTLVKRRQGKHEVRPQDECLTSPVSVFSKSNLPLLQVANG